VFDVSGGESDFADFEEFQFFGGFAAF